MVKFELIEQNENFLKYEYYPEADKTKKPGIIIVDLKEEFIDVETPAEDDWQDKISVESLKGMRESINIERREQGLPDFTEEEFPYPTEDKLFYHYAEFAIKRIAEALNEGEVLESGGAYWY